MFPIAYEALLEPKNKETNLSSYFITFIEWKRQQQLSKANHLFLFNLWCYLHNILEDVFWGDSFETKRFSRWSSFPISHSILVIPAASQKNRESHQNFLNYQLLLDCNNFAKSFLKGKTFYKKIKNMRYFKRYHFFPTCLTNTFFITTIGDSAGKELLVVLGHCQGPSSAFQHSAFSTSSESVCSIALGHSELPSARCRIQLLVVSRAIRLLLPSSSTILPPFNEVTKNNKV